VGFALSSLWAAPYSAAQELESVLPDGMWVVPRNIDEATLSVLPDEESLATYEALANEALASRSPERRALGTYALVQIEWVREVTKAKSSLLLGEPVDVAEPDYSAVRARFVELSLPAKVTTLEEAGLSIAFAISAQGHPANEEAARAALTRVVDSDLGALTDAAAVALVQLTGSSDEALPKSPAPEYRLLLLLAAARIADQKGNSALAERRYLALLDAIDADLGWSRISRNLLRDIAVRTLVAGARKEAGWVRGVSLLDGLPEGLEGEVLDGALSALSAEPTGVLASNDAFLHLRAAEDAEPAQAEAHLEASVSALEQLTDLQSAELCSTLAEQSRRRSLDGAVLGRVFGGCLKRLRAATELDLAGRIAVMDAIDGLRPDVFESEDHARYGLTLLADGQGTLAVGHLDQVDIALLPEALRNEFVVAAVRFRHQYNLDTHVDKLSCSGLTKKSLVGLEGRLEEWLKVALEVTSGAELYEMRRIELALLMMKESYDEAAERMVPFITLVDSLDDDGMRDELVMGLSDLLDCFDRSERWDLLSQLTPLLRGELDEELRTALFDIVGNLLMEANLRWVATLTLVGRDEEALAVLVTLQQQWRQNPGMARAAFWTAELMFKAGRNEEAAHYYQHVFEESPESELADDALFALASIFLESGDVKSAEEALDQILSNYPGGNFPQRASVLLEGLEEAAP